MSLTGVAAAAVRLACVALFFSRHALAHAVERVITRAVTKAGG